MNSSVRNFLRSQAHSLKPIVMVGKGGMDERVVAALREALSAHELVKVKFQACKDEIRPISEELAQRTGSEVVSIIGFIVTFYQESEEHLIHIPKELIKKELEH
ncbi:MAG: ribosome assembly RNA-binding protein YhbY [Sphaerochaetaceae bacterium]